MVYAQERAAKLLREEVQKGKDLLRGRGRKKRIQVLVEEGKKRKGIAARRGKGISGEGCVGWRRDQD